MRIQWQLKLVLFFILIQIPCNVFSQDLTPQEIEERIRSRWSFVTRKDYPKNSDAVLRIIRRYAPNETYALISAGFAEINKKAYEDALSYFEVVTRGEPDDVRGYYGAGICKREIGTGQAATLQMLSWLGAKQYFEKGMSVDSTYVDILYQFALLKRYQKRHFEAVSLVERQLKVGQPRSAQVGIFRIYDYLIANKGKEEVESFLNAQESAHAFYAIGELYRRNLDFKRAESILNIVLNGAEIPLLPVYMSLVRLMVQTDQPQKAHDLYWQGVRSINSIMDAELLLEDILCIANDQEYEILWRDLSNQALHRGLELFWLRRNPLPAASFNSRLVEHYRRLVYAERYFRYDGFRLWVYKDDRTNQIQFPKWYTYNYKFNDQGLIHIRYGAPDEKAVALVRTGYTDDESNVAAGLSEPSRSNMSWLYHPRGEWSKMIFHYSISEDAPVGYWKLVPGFVEADILQTMLHWDEIYNRLLTAREHERFSILSELSRERAAMVEQSMQTDRHSWETEMEPLDMMHSVAQFRESPNQDLLQFSYAIPFSSLINNKATSDSIRFEAGIVIYDQHMAEVFKDVREFAFRGRNDSHIYNNTFIDEFEFPVELKKYNIAIHAKVPSTNRLNGWRFEYPLDGSERERLACSSIKLAYEIEPTTESDLRDKKALDIIPNPTKRFRKRDPLYAYYEIYNLTYNNQGSTDYTLRFTLKETKKNQNVFSRVAGIFGGREDFQVSLENTQSSADRRITDYIAFDMSRLGKGAHELSLVVTDNVTGESTSTVAEFELR